MRRHSPIGLFFSSTLLISVIFHVVFLRVLPVHAVRAAFEANRLDFELIEPPPLPAPPPKPPQSQPPAPPPARPAPPLKPTRKTPRVTVTDPHKPDAELPAKTPEPPAVSPLPSTPAEPNTGPGAKQDIPHKPLNLSARSAAMSVWQPQEPEPSHEPRQRSTAEIEREASLALNQRLKPPPAARDEPLEITCNAQRQCEFHGQALDAVIFPDGSYRIDEKPTPVPMGIGMPMGMGAANGGLTKPEDIQAAREANLALIKRPPIAAERARFLKETEALRQEHIDTWNKQIEADGAHRFQARIDEIWRAPTLSPQQKRHQLFLLWEGIGQDEHGAHYKSIIIKYIQHNLPEHKIGRAHV
jgi:hypothetical protein